MNLEIIPKMQWYRRLLRRFNTVFTGQAALQNKLDAQTAEIRRLYQEQQASTAEMLKNLQQDFAQRKKELHLLQEIHRNIEERLQCVQKSQQSIEERLQCVQKSQQSIEERLQCVQKSQQSIEERLQCVQKSQQSIEHIRNDLCLIQDSFYQGLQRPFAPDIEKKSCEYQRLLRLHELLHLRDVEGGTLVRIGREHDGGYLMLDEFHPGMIAYSFGISDDVSWDKAMAERDIACFMYDHTIDKLPEEHKFFHWSREGICGAEHQEHCRTLEAFIKSNGHEERNDLILKMDVEGTEWDAVAATSSATLALFSQIVFELHDVYSAVLHNKICAVLSKLNKTHQPVYVHGNNWADYERAGDLVMPWALEVLYVRKNDHNFRESSHFYPLEQDMPNKANRRDIRLGVWNTH